MTALYLIVGGSLGTLARYYLAGRVDDALGPSGIGIFAVNILGSFLIGLFLTLSEERFMWPPELRLALAVGFLGAFTTFSTLTWETAQMLELRNVGGALLNIGATVVAGMLAVFGGIAVGRAL